MNRKIKKIIKNQNLWIVIGVIILAVVLIYGGNKGWFQFIVNINNPPGDNGPEYINPDTNTQKYYTCQELCTSQSFTESYSSTSCLPGETQAIYGYPDSAPILSCCCYNLDTPIEGRCTETDGGRFEDIPGTTTGKDGVARMDYCFDSTTVYEYSCDNTDWTGGKISCDAGQTCLASRSGGYCHTRTWNEGDTVFQGSGAGQSVAGETGFAELDLSKFGLATGGMCQLGAKLDVSWNYVDPQLCQGMPGQQGMLWQFFDSSGLEYERLDPVPVSWAVDLHPRGYALHWDGHTPWRGTVTRVPDVFPGCLINYQYSIRVYIYECL